jgi:ketosteroid isomerase-like protein
MTVRAIVEDYYNFANNGDWENCLALLSDDVVVDDQLAGHLAGIKVLRKAADAVSSGEGQFRAYPQHTIVDGDVACVMWHYEGKNPQGAKIAYPGDADRPVVGTTLFQVKNEKITYMRTVHDSVPFVDAARS